MGMKNFLLFENKSGIITCKEILFLNDLCISLNSVTAARSYI